MRGKDQQKLRCSFCDKSLREVKKLIASSLPGPGVYICDECIDLASEVLEDELPSWPWQRQ